MRKNTAFNMVFSDGGVFMKSFDGQWSWFKIFTLFDVIYEV